MNLIELIKKNDALISLLDKYSALKAEEIITKRRIENKLLRGLVFDSDFCIKLERPFRFMPFMEWPEYTGWFLWTAKTPANDLNASISITYADKEIISIPVRARNRLMPIPLPKPVNGEYLPSELSLQLSMSEDYSGEVIVFAHHVLSRQWLYDLCKGFGVEIGPGPRPQIFPADDTDVIYVEQKEQQEWSDLYSTYKKQNADNSDIWKRYEVGEADNLPVEKESCDFIFSSHMFEHLANPIAHIEYWLSCLKSGGHILAVVPDMAACRDYVMHPSTWEEILAEYNSGNFKPMRSHYERVEKYGRLGMTVDEAIERQWSIHVHYYRATQLALFFSHLEKILPIQGWSILNTANHKDFHFVIKKK